MSKYRYAFQNGTLVKQKRSLLFFWRWPFNVSEEDELNKLMNQIVTLSGQVSRARRLLPKKAAQLKAKKAAFTQYLQQSGQKAGPTWRDSWRPRKEPVKLIEDLKVATKKGDRRDRGPIPPTEIARLVVDPTANSQARKQHNKPRRS